LSDSLHVADDGVGLLVEQLQTALEHLLSSVVVDVVVVTVRALVWHAASAVQLSRPHQLPGVIGTMLAVIVVAFALQLLLYLYHQPHRQPLHTLDQLVVMREVPAIGAAKRAGLVE